MNRRDLVRTILSGTFLGSAMVAGLGSSLHAQQSPVFESGRMRARAIAPVDNPTPAGLHPLKIRSYRDTLVYIPEAASKFQKVPCVLSLHGATQNAERGISLFQKMSDEHGFMIVAPASASTTWENGNPGGADFDNVDESLAISFSLRNVDPTRISIAGFSDGASYSLFMGLSNGDLFNSVMAFSSGYIAGGRRAGKPPVFLSHGTADPIFPIEATGRVVETDLKKAGYAVTFRQFEGRHAFPPDVAADAAKWLMAAPPLKS